MLIFKIKAQILSIKLFYLIVILKYIIFTMLALSGIYYTNGFCPDQLRCNLQCS